MPETALPVEISQVWIEVYMEPLHSSVPGYPYRLSHQLPADTTPTEIWMNGHVKQEGVGASVQGQNR